MVKFFSTLKIHGEIVSDRGVESELAAPLNMWQGANLQPESYKCCLFVGGNPATLPYVERP